MAKNPKTIAKDIISKLKDDGDFDRLRLKLVRHLKQNEDLRNSIVSAVKQSASLNRPGATNLKPRQLCDAIHDEIREQAMNQISDGLLEIIRSEDGMKTEIKETVQSVYDKLLNSQQKAEGEPTSSLGQKPNRQGAESNGTVMVSGESNGIVSNGQPKEVPGFSLPNHTGSNSPDSQSELQKPNPGHIRLPEKEREFHRCTSPSRTEEKKRSTTSRSLSSGKRKRASGVNDEDPDIPPGFG